MLKRSRTYSGQLFTEHKPHLALDRHGKRKGKLINQRINGVFQALDEVEQRTAWGGFLL